MHEKLQPTLRSRLRLDCTGQEHVHEPTRRFHCLVARPGRSLRLVFMVKRTRVDLYALGCCAAELLILQCCCMRCQLKLAAKRDQPYGGGNNKCWARWRRSLSTSSSVPNDMIAEWSPELTRSNWRESEGVTAIRLTTFSLRDAFVRSSSLDRSFHSRGESQTGVGQTQAQVNQLSVHTNKSS